MKKEQLHYIYKITNKINGKFYIGVHSTYNLDDGYMGNGIIRMSDAIRKSKKSRFCGLAHAYVKYGMDNFDKTILFLYDTKEEAYEAEAFLVTDSVVKSKDNYNLKEGGLVPPNPKGIKRTEEFKKQRSKDIHNHMDKLISISAKEFVFVNLTSGEVFKEKNLAAFCRKHKLVESCIRSVVLGRIEKTSDNWWACRLEDWKGKPIFKERKVPKPIKGILRHKDGRVVSFNSLREAADKTGADRSAISKVLRGVFNQTKGWTL